MTPGYSKILINELVIPDQDASAFMTRSDLNMMVHFAAMERSEKQWRELLGQAGLEIINIWTEEAGSESIIESMIK